MLFENKIQQPHRPGFVRNKFVKPINSITKHSLCLPKVLSLQDDVTYFRTLANSVNSLQSEKFDLKLVNELHKKGINITDYRYKTIKKH